MYLSGKNANFTKSISKDRHLVATKNNEAAIQCILLVILTVRYWSSRNVFFVFLEPFHICILVDLSFTNS